jgi:DNA-binding MurR/RpiR family transcriptional regulator
MDYINRWGLLNSLISIINEGSDDDTNVILAKYFLQNYNRLHELNVYDIAEECFVSRATVRRLSQSLGYTNFKDLKEQFDNFYNNYSFYRFGIQTNIEGQSVATQLYEMAMECDRNLTSEVLDRAVTKIYQSNQIVFLTSDVYSNQSSEFQKAMILSGKIVRVISNKFEDNLILKKLCSEDLLIVISVTGFFASVSLDMVNSLDVHKILITTIHKPLYEKCYNEVWYLSSSDKSQKRSVYTIYALEYYLESIYAAYIKKYGK